MAEQTKKMVPPIRFKGFSDEWDERPIGEVLTEKKRTIELEDNELYELVTVRRRNGGVVSRGYLQGKDILVKNYSQLRAGDFIISKRQVVHGATGIVPQHLDQAIVSNEYMVAVGNENISSEFLTIISTLPDMYRKFFLSSYGVDIEKLFFDAADWKKRNVVIPKLPEQNEICSYFAAIDQMIGLHQRKHEKLVMLKKAMLKKMFPQNGATTPEIRFKGFSEPWEEKKLGGFVDITTGKLDANAMTDDGIYDFYTSGIKKYKIDISAFEGPAITIAGNGATVGYMHIANGKFNAYQRTYVLTQFKIHRQFAFFGIGNVLPYKISQEARTGNIPYIVLDMLTDLQLFIPLPDEQQKIGTYFRQLDELITQHGTQVAKLKQIKIACLEKMFV